MSTSAVASAALSATQVAEYHGKGYIALKGAFSSSEVSAIQAECDRLFSLHTEDKDKHNLRVQFRQSASGRAVLDRIDPFIDISPVLRDLGNDPRIVDAVSAIFGEQASLFKDKMILKRPGTHGYGVHQDYTNWQEVPPPAELLISVLVSVDDSSRENGALELFPGMHQNHYREREVPSDIFNPKAGLVPDEVMAGRPSELIDLKAGDLVFFHSLTPHQSGVNTSNQTRRAIYFSYAPARFGDVYSTYYKNFYSYLRKDRAAEGDRLFFR